MSNQKLTEDEYKLVELIKINKVMSSELLDQHQNVTLNRLSYDNIVRKDISFVPHLKLTWLITDIGENLLRERDIKINLEHDVIVALEEIKRIKYKNYKHYKEITEKDTVIDLINSEYQRLKTKQLEELSGRVSFVTEDAHPNTKSIMSEIKKDMIDTSRKLLKLLTNAGDW